MSKRKRKTDESSDTRRENAAPRTKGADAHAADTSRASWGVFLALLGGVLLLVAVAHWPVLSAQALSLDDDAFLTSNPLVRNPSWNSTGRFLGEVFEPSTVRGYYIPLSMISLMVDYARGGRPEDLTAFHQTALLLHLANTALLMALLFLLFRQAWPAAIGALLFGLHPLTVEPVVWIGERKTLLAGFFALLSLVCYVASTRRRGWALLVVAALMYVLALMSKPTATPLPALLIVLDWWPLRRLNKRTLLEKIPFFAIAGVSVIITLVSHAKTASLAVGEQGTVQVALLAIHNLVFYARKLIWPGVLTSAYVPPRTLSLGEPAILVSAIALIALIAIALISLRKTRGIAAGLAIFILALAPTLGVARYSWVNVSDKYVYPLPALGLLLPLAALLVWLWRAEPSIAAAWRRRLAAGGVALVLAGLCIGATRSYLTKWQTTESIYRHMIEHAPDVALLRSNLALELASQGRVDEAIACYREALRLDPKSYKVLTNLGVALASRGQFAEAAEQYRAALAIDASEAMVHNNLGDALVNLGRLDEGMQCFDEALKLDPRSADAHNNRGRVLLLTNRNQEALPEFQAAVECNPRLVQAYSNMGVAYARLGQTEQAIASYQKALSINPAFVEARNNLGMNYMRAQRYEQAVEQFQLVLRAQPGFADAYRNLGAALAALGRFDEAARAYEGALQLNPNDQRARAGLQAARKRQ